eukprot:2254175-Pyramimonas_sp.AAC.1
MSVGWGCHGAVRDIGGFEAKHCCGAVRGIRGFQARNCRVGCTQPSSRRVGMPGRGGGYLCVRGQILWCQEQSFRGVILFEERTVVLEVVVN